MGIACSIKRKTGYVEDLPDKIKMRFALVIFAGAQTNRDLFWSVGMTVPAFRRVMDRPLHGPCMNDLHWHSDTTMGIDVFHWVDEPFFSKGSVRTSCRSMFVNSVFALYQLFLS